MSKEKEHVEKTIQKTNDLETLTQLKLGMKSKTKQFLLHSWHPSWLLLFMLLVVYIVLVLRTTFYLLKKHTWPSSMVIWFTSTYLITGVEMKIQNLYFRLIMMQTPTQGKSRFSCLLPPFINLGFLSFQTVVFFLLEKMSILCFNVIVITFWSYPTE